MWKLDAVDRVWNPCTEKAETGGSMESAGKPVKLNQWAPGSMRHPVLKCKAENNWGRHSVFTLGLHGNIHIHTYKCIHVQTNKHTSSIYPHKMILCYSEIQTKLEKPDSFLGGWGRRGGKSNYITFPPTFLYHPIWSFNLPMKSPSHQLQNHCSKFILVRAL